MIIYDCEIIRAIPPKDPADTIEGIEYCGRGPPRRVVRVGLGETVG